MAALALSDFLQDFGRRPGQPPINPLMEQPKPVQPVVFESRQDDIDRQIAAAVAKAEEETTERVSILYEGTLQAEREKHAAEVAELRTALGAEASARVAEQLDELESRLASLATSSAARILATFLGDEMQRRSLERLASLIRQAVNDRDTVRIEVRGPQHLFEPLMQALGERAVGIEFVESDGLDLSVNVDGSLFETRLGEWSTAIEEAMR